MTTLAQRAADAPEERLQAGDAVYVETSGTWVRGILLAIRGRWYTVRLVGERRADDWQRSQIRPA